MCASSKAWNSPFSPALREIVQKPKTRAYRLVAAIDSVSNFLPKTEEWRKVMKRLILAGLISLFAVGSAMAGACETKAVGKDGKPLAGAAKTSFVKKCKADACEGKAVSKDGKPLSGAAKDSVMKKCEADA
jgi:hypothetical protein